MNRQTTRNQNTDSYRTESKNLDQRVFLISVKRKPDLLLLTN